MFTSCDCQNDPLSLEYGMPTNISVNNCEIPKYYGYQVIRSNIEPRNLSGYEYFNPQTLNYYMEDYQLIDCGDELSDNCKKVYVSTDPRLTDVARSINTALDRPPISGTVHMKDVYNLPDDYGKSNYRTYKDVNLGQILYYNDKSIEDPFFNPNFTNSARMNATLFQDPMNSLKPNYNRVPLKCDNHLNTTRNHYDGELSWMEDTQEFREDLMARQMRKRNQERWNSRWQN